MALAAALRAAAGATGGGYQRSSSLLSTVSRLCAAAGQRGVAGAPGGGGGGGTAVVVAVGSNLGDRAANMEEGLRQLREAGALSVSIAAAPSKAPTSTTPGPCLTHLLRRKRLRRPPHAAL